MGPLPPQIQTAATRRRLICLSLLRLRSICDAPPVSTPPVVRTICRGRRLRGRQMGPPQQQFLPVAGWPRRWCWAHSGCPQSAASFHLRPDLGAPRGVAYAIPSWRGRERRCRRRHPRDLLAVLAAGIIRVPTTPCIGSWPAWARAAAPATVPVSLWRRWPAEGAALECLVFWAKV